MRSPAFERSGLVETGLLTWHISCPVSSGSYPIELQYTLDQSLFNKTITKKEGYVSDLKQRIPGMILGVAFRITVVGRLYD